MAKFNWLHSNTYKFNKVMEFTLGWEGGISDHAADPGGLTSFGISKRSYPDIDIPNLTEEKAKEIYRRDYWDKIRGDSLTPPVALAVMDFAVNSGVARAAKALQKAVGVEEDGTIGNNTLKAVKAYGNDRSIGVAVVETRVKFLCNLVKIKPSMSVFLYGWMRRTHQCMAEVSRS
jgi:lysozyme family protein